MQHCTYEFTEANRGMRQIEEEHNLTQWQKDIGTILASRRYNDLHDKVAKERYKECCEDPKFKPTKDIIDDYTAIEIGDVLAQYRYYEMCSKQALKEYEMWQGQLFKHQSELKFKGLEMMQLGIGDGKPTSGEQRMGNSKNTW